MATIISFLQLDIMRAHLACLFPLYSEAEVMGDTTGVSRELSFSDSFLIVTFRCFGGGGRVDLFEGTEVEGDVTVVKLDEDVCGVVEVEAKLSLRKARGSSSFSSSILSARSRRFGL